MTCGTANCNTPYVVYLIQCCQCGNQYVGQTAQSIERRLQRHLSAIRDRHHPGVLQEHFRRGECSGIDNILFQILHVITPNINDNPHIIQDKLKSLEFLWMDKLKCESLEFLWMDRLKCEYPQGLNWARYDPVERHKYYQLGT